jgi:hypothetical protein
MPLTSRTFDQLIDFTRTSAATFVGSNGLVQTTPASVNLLTFTQEFDNGVWAKIALTATANTTTAPDGTSTADTITASAGTSARNTNTGGGGSGAAITLSVYAKQGTLGFVQLSHAASATIFGNFNLATGAVGTVGAGATAAIVSVGSGWYRCSITFTPGSAGASRIGPVTSGTAVYAESWTAAGTETIFLWGAQLELGSTATTYTRNFGGLFPPRFDYNPVTLAPRGLLIEEQRTNLFTYSADFTNVAWGKANITATGDAATAPDGTATADKLEVTATGVGTVGSRSITSVTGTTAAYSIYVKQGTGATVANGFALRNSTTSTNLISGTLNYTTGVWTYATGSTGVTVQDAGNGWWRLTLAASSGITSGDTLTVYYGYVGGTSVTAGDHFFIWGAQLEVGAFPTSYIPTVASQVTRAADLPLIQAPNFSPWYNQPEGSFIAEFTPDTTVASNLVRVLVASQVSAAARVVDIHAGIGVWQSFNGTTNVVGGASAVTSVPQKFGAAFRAGDYAACLNGGTVGTATTATVNSPTQLALGYFPSGNVQQLNGHLRRITFYPTRLTNAQLQALTT